jgi:serine/threonine protein kinase
MSEKTLQFDARGLAKAILGANATPSHRSQSTEWFAKPQFAHDELNFIEELYFYHGIHPSSRIFVNNDVDGVKRPHSIIGMEILSGGDMIERLNNEERLVTEFEAWGYTRYVVFVDRVVLTYSDILFAVQQLHKSGLAHRDIKFNNFCYGEDDKLTMIDFGM